MTSPRRWRRWFFGRRTLAAAAAVVVVVGGWHYWVVYSSLRAAERELLASEAALRGSLSGGGSTAELDAAERRLGNAQSEIREAKRHVRWDPLLQLGGQVPGPGANVEALERVLNVAGNMTEAGQEAIVIARELDAVRSDTRDPEQSRVAASAAALERLAPNIERIGGLLAEAEAERRALGDPELLPPLAKAVDRIDRELPGLIRSFETVETVQQLAPAMLGMDGPRRYLVFALNNGEILPGGGLVTAAGVVDVNGGEIGDEIDFEDSTTWLYGWVVQGGGYIEPPGPLKRYLLQDYPWNLAVANWSPDFTVWARQATEFYEMVHGPQETQGALAIDLDVVQRLLRLSGAVTITVEGEGPVTFDSENAVMELERLTRPGSGEPDDRKSVLGVLTPVLLERIENLPADQWPELIEALQELVAEKHIQVFANDEGEQAMLERLGASGRLDSGPGDFLMVNEASVLSTKLALILERDVVHEVALQADGSAAHTLRYRVANPLSEWAAAWDPQLVSDLMGDGRYGLYLRVFTPVDAWGFVVEANGAPASVEDSGLDGGRLWTGVFTAVPKDTSAEIVVRWTVPHAEDAGEAYELFVQQQAGLGELCTTWVVSREGVPAAVSINGALIDTAVPACHARDLRVRIE